MFVFFVFLYFRSRYVAVKRLTNTLSLGDDIVVNGQASGCACRRRTQPEPVLCLDFTLSAVSVQRTLKNGL